MPPRVKFSREEIVQAALDVAREKGADAMTTRDIAARLGVSTQPIFTYFRSMAEVRAAVHAAAETFYQKYAAEGLAEEIPFLGYGMRHIRFAREERALFRLLFMRDRSHETIGSQDEEIRPLLALIQKNVGIGEAEARQLHLELWVFVHGIATMLATSYLDWPDAFVSDMLTELYRDMTQRYTKKEEV